MNKIVILITGANRGIGFELSKLLALQDQFLVLFTCRNSAEGLLKFRELQKLVSDVRFFTLDVTKPNDITKLKEEIQNSIGKIDILVNNAGIYLDSEDLDEFPSFMDTTGNVLEKTFETNLFGPMNLSQSLLPLFSPKGLIINISSGGGKINTSGDRSGHIAYRTSKTALNAFTKSFGNQKNSKNIKMISICPGWVQTDLGGPNAPRTIIEGAKDILQVILHQNDFKSGAFIYNSVPQNL